MESAQKESSGPCNVARSGPAGRLSFARSPVYSPPPMPRDRREWWIRNCLLGANFAGPATLILTRFQHTWLIVAAALAHGAFAYAVMKPSCNWFGPVVTRFKPRGREVWLTIDDGPAGSATEALSEAMQQRGVRATFFVKGSNLEAHPDTARLVIGAGHTLANHTHTHPAHCFAWLRPAALRREVDRCNAALGRVGVERPRWFRSPVGLKHTRLHPTLAARGMRLIGWSTRSGDGLRCDPEAVARRVVREVHPGAILLLHEGRPRSNEAILRVIDELHQLGYIFVIPHDEQLA